MYNGARKIKRSRPHRVHPQRAVKGEEKKKFDPFGGGMPSLVRRSEKAPLRVNPELTQGLRQWSRRVDLHINMCNKSLRDGA